MRNTRKPLAAGIALALVAALGAGATLAWLTDRDEATNTFTVGNIDISLWEHDYDPEGNALAEKVVGENADYKMVPGVAMPKDPTVTVEGGSEDCWLFVQVAEQGGSVSWTEKDASGQDVVQERAFGDFVGYQVDDRVWAPLKDEDSDGVADDGVYYRKVAASDADQSFKVLEGDQVVTKSTVTKEMMDALGANGAESPTLTFKAYAVQLYESNGKEFSPADAWEQAETQS